MTDWRRYTIMEKNNYTHDTLSLVLDYYVELGSGWQTSCIQCEKVYPFDTWQVGDQIEIDNDHVKSKMFGKFTYFAYDTFIRKGNSASLPPSHLYYSSGDYVMKEVQQPPLKK
jgi:hypothetical protein